MPSQRCCMRSPPTASASYGRRARRFRTQIRRNPPSGSLCLRNMPRGGRVSGRMAPASKKPGSRRPSSSRRIIVVVVPPVDELDLVGPLQVFNSVNRLAGKPIYSIEVVTNAHDLSLEGEGGVLTFVAQRHFKKVEGASDSVLLVCG